MYQLDYTVKMFDSDASGFLFFTSQMRMAHEAYEAFMESEGLGISKILRADDFLLPIVHAETDYRGPTHVGDRVRIEVTAQRIGTTSFTLAYRFVAEGEREVGTANTVHVAIAKASLEKRALPEHLRKAVETLSAD